LASHGRPIASRITALFEQKETLSPFGAAQLALAMPASDRRRETLLREWVRRALSALDAQANVPALQASQTNVRANGVFASTEELLSSRRWYETSTRSLAALLRASAELFPGSEDTRRLASYLLQRRTQGAWNSPHDNAHALSALSTLARRFSERDLPRVTVTLDGTPVAETQDNASPRRARRFALPADRLVAGRHQLLIRGLDEDGFFALDGRWTRALSAQDDEARGRVAALHRVLERENGERIERGGHVRAGELVRVRLFLFSEQPPQSLVLRDAIGGGFDAVDRGLDSTPQASLEAILGGSTEDEVIDPRGYYAERSLPYLQHRTFAPGEARFFLDRPTATLLEYTYAVRATTPGTFVLLPARVEAPHDTTWVARSATTTVVVDP
jgi:uncharacterized protein YfaS (alpha-2-macroglobulin family)